jgi:hypothetical protein
MEENFERWRALAVDAITEAPSLGVLFGAAAGACLRQIPEVRIPTTMYHTHGGALDGQVMALRLLASIDRDPRWHPGEVATQRGLGELVMLADGAFVVLGGIDPDLSVVLGEAVTAEGRRTNGASIISVGTSPMTLNMPNPEAVRGLALEVDTESLPIWPAADQTWNGAAMATIIAGHSLAGQRFRAAAQANPERYMEVLESYDDPVVALAAAGLVLAEEVMGSFFLESHQILSNI